MNKDKIKLRDIVLKYVDIFCGDEKQDAERQIIIEMVSEQLVKDFEQEIKEKYKRELAAEINSELKKIIQVEARKQKINQIIVLLIETVILSGIIGLIVNQITDVFQLLKNENNYVGLTLFLIVFFLVILIGFMFFMYLNRLNDVLEKRMDEYVENVEEDKKI